MKKVAIESPNMIILQDVPSDMLYDKVELYKALLGLSESDKVDVSVAGPCTDMRGESVHPLYEGGMFHLGARPEFNKLLVKTKDGLIIKADNDIWERVRLIHHLA